MRKIFSALGAAAMAAALAASPAVSLADGRTGTLAYPGATGLTLSAVLALPDGAA